jgi:hypothetical protein
MRHITLASLAMFALMSAGCASGPTFSESGDAALKPPPGQALVFLLRTPNFVDSATTYNLGLNGKPLTTMPNGGYHVFTHTPGTMKFSCAVFGDGPEIFRTDAQADTVHYLKFAFSQIEELPPAKGQEAVARCRRIDPGNSVPHFSSAVTTTRRPEPTVASVQPMTPPNTDWRQDFGALVTKLVALAPQTRGQVGDAHTEEFKEQAVSWKLSFKEAKQDAGKLKLTFDLEPFGIRQQFFSGHPVLAGFEAAAGTADDWKAIKPGSSVNISATLKKVIFFQMTPGNSTRAYDAAMVSVEDVKIVRDR